MASEDKTDDYTNPLAIEREKLELERERLILERERLETERIRHGQTVKLTNNAAGRIVLPASSFVLTILLSLLIGSGLGAWTWSSYFKPDKAAIAASVADALSTQSYSTNTVSTTTGRTSRPPINLLILD